MHTQRFKFKLSTVIIFFVCLVVLVSLMITDLLISNTVSENIQKHQEEKARMVSRSIATSHIVIEALEDGRKTNEIQDYTKDIQAATDMMFIVVMDMNGIRKSHPNPDQIGKHFVGGDEKEALKGREYVSSSNGTLGKSLRAFTPIYNVIGEQIGVAAVGIALESVKAALGKSHRSILTVTILGLLVGIIGAVLLAKYIKRILFGLEPFAIAKIFVERSTMLQSVHEGIIAVDNEQTITLVNRSARQIFKKAGLSKDPVGMKVHEFLQSTRLDQVLEKGKPELDEEQIINGVSILVNRVPLIVKGEVVGAISTFRDKTDVNQLAEQLTGVKTYAEALRAQSHEFMNRLHVILGMVQMKCYDELSDYIRAIVGHHNQELGNMAQSIKDPALAGFLMGKLSYAREERVAFNIEVHSVIPEPASPKMTHELITILGNLIDNAIEAMADSIDKTLDVNLQYSGKFLTMEVMDSGPGIPNEIQRNVLEKGYSTKGENRGYGLYLVTKSIENLGGEMTIDSKSLLGTEIHITIPYEVKGESHD
ncbi:DcuS/MalK family sensor histidine kinase [Neobacillus niacini]|uniref:DcuS/MalK family sensor histidine kinase n=1 Tax=Neobacillus niacini TaxID=86668 RepID=UPI00052FDAB5|nr:DcuS/MalK family sensor histidine kinase [Neobacillus niacini]KGM45748.1 histidine kinase [Neobacillus niacini]MEC1523736.1 DcuS/MalK family sensor histidine kinase [Neobacillus niacini]